MLCSRCGDYEAISEFGFCSDFCFWVEAIVNLFGEFDCA